MRALLGILVLLLSSVGAVGSDSSISLQLKDVLLETAAQKLSEQAKTHVLADPAVAAKVTVSLTSVPLETALDTICAASDLSWYLVKMDLPKDTEPDAAQVAGIVRLLAGMESSTFIAEQPRGTLKARIQRGGGAEAEPDGLTSVYLVTSSDLKAPAQPPGRVDRMIDLQRESMKLMFQLTPDEYTQMMERSMEMFMNMDPAERAAMMNRTLLGLSKMNPDKFHAMVSEFIGLAKDIPPETLKALADMWGVEPDQEPGGPAPPGR
jgi:hypothetical protein